MNDEIKEILETLGGIASGDWIQMLPKEADKLLDYITNLQENYERIYNENCKLREQHNIDDISLLDENERLNTNLQEKQHLIDNIAELIGLEEGSIAEELYDGVKDYKSRIDKTVEYIETHKVSDTITFPLMKKEMEQDVKNCFDYEFNQIYKKDLLNILNGDEDE